MLPGYASSKAVHISSPLFDRSPKTGHPKSSTGAAIAANTNYNGIDNTLYNVLRLLVPKVLATSNKKHSNIVPCQQRFSVQHSAAHICKVDSRECIDFACIPTDVE